MGRKSTSFYVDEDHLEWMERENINRSELVNDLLGRYRDGKGQMDAAIREFRIEQLEDEAEELESEAETKLSRAEKKRERIEDLKQKYSAQEEAKEDSIDSILNDMVETGSSIWPEANQVIELARKHFGGADNNQVAFSAIKERAEERELDLPPEQFEYGRGDMR